MNKKNNDAAVLRTLKEGGSKGWPRFLALFFLGFVLSSCEEQSNKEEDHSAIPVSTYVTQLQLVNVDYKSIGTLMARSAPVIRAQIPGEINQILVHEGQEVHKGDLLIQLENKKSQFIIRKAKAKLSQSEALLNESMHEVNRANKLIGKGYISQEQYDQIQGQYQTAKANLAVATEELAHTQFEITQGKVLSPVNGHVGRITVSVGEYISEGKEMLNIVNHEQLLAEFPLSEQKNGLIEPGQKIILTSASSPKESITSTVTSIAPDVNPDNRAIKVLIVFANKYGWKPGSSIEGVIYTRSLEAIMVPEESILERNNKPIIYVVKKNKAYARVISTGYKTEGWVAVTKGIKPGEEVVITGAYYLSEGIPIIVQNKEENQ